MNFILTRDKAITIAPAALKLSGIPDDAKLELTTLDGAVILTRSKMTAMEYVKLLTELTAHVGQMLLTLRDTCGHCDECDEDECACRDLPIEELIRPAVTSPIGPERKRISRPMPSWAAMWMRTPARSPSARQIMSMTSPMSRLRFCSPCVSLAVACLCWKMC